MKSKCMRIPAYIRGKYPDTIPESMPLPILSITNLFRIDSKKHFLGLVVYVKKIFVHSFLLELSIGRII